MKHTSLVRPAVTPASITSSAAVSGLPRNLLAVAARRLGLVAIITMVVSVVSFAAADPWSEDDASRWWERDRPTTSGETRGADTLPLAGAL